MAQDIWHRDSCRGCGSNDLFMFLDLGRMPLAGGFLVQQDIDREKKFPLKVYYCRDCGLVQILDVINPTILFKNYCYVSSVIKSLSEHFLDYATYLVENFCSSKNSRILEFGCNDGVLLQYLSNFSHLQSFGVDPSENVTKIARERGYEVYTSYFDQKTASEIHENLGSFDVVTGSNVFAHTDDIIEIIEAAKILLKDDGVFIIEVHYLRDLLEIFQYDTIYHEHLCYYSVTSLVNILSKVGMRVVDVIHIDVHGGSIRVIASKESSELSVKSSVSEFLKNEKHINEEFLRRFGESCFNHREKLLRLVEGIKGKGNTIVGYGAPGRGTILLNYCDIGKNYLDYIVDVSPLRAGKLMPGVHVPIYDVSIARENPPDYFLLLAWNYYSSIREQEKALIKSGVKFILPFPEIIME